MDTITDVRIDESQRQALSRLLQKARAEGVQLMRDRDGRHFATSTSQPGHLHYVTGYSCDCRGFVTHGRCKHYAALLSALGWLEPAPTGCETLAITCSHVSGHYSLSNEPEWVEPVTTIAIDGVDKVRITGDTFALSVHWLEQNRPIDDLTGCTHPYLDHAGAVEYWIHSLDDRVPAHVPMQAAGLFPAGEFVDDEPALAVA